MKNSKLRKSAKGQACQVRIPGICRNRTETVCLGHMGGAGWALKALDIHGAYICFECHNAVDGRVPCGWDEDLLKLWFLEGVVRTQKIMVENGLIKF